MQNKQGLLKEALANGLEALRRAEEMGQAQLLRDAYEIVAGIYEKMGNGNQAIKYYRKYKLYADSLTSIESERAAANYKAGYEFSKKELEYERRSLQQRWFIFSACAALAFTAHHTGSSSFATGNALPCPTKTFSIKMKL
ncbi:MAG: hypothetical protein WKF59_19755 [Chitinophagaceae bacterium]